MSLPSRNGGNVETRALPEVKAGDYLVLHDTGAYGASMSSNYNSRPLLPEVLFDNGQARLIRRRQTIEELLALELHFELRLVAGCMMTCLQRRS